MKNEKHIKGRLRSVHFFILKMDPEPQEQLQLTSTSIKKVKVNIYDGREMMNTPLNIAVLDLPTNNQWGKLVIDVNGEPIKIKFNGLAKHHEFEMSTYGKSPKLQLCVSTSPDPYFEAFSDSFRRTIQGYIDDRTLPDVQAVVRPLVRNAAVYISWPKGRGPHPFGLIDGPTGSKIGVATESYQKLQSQYLIKECEFTIEVKPWVMKVIGEDSQLDIGFSMTLLAVKTSSDKPSQ